MFGKKFDKNLDKFIKVINALGIPSLVVLIGLFYYHQIQMNKEIVENKNSQIQLLNMMQSDLVLQRLIKAKELYQKDINTLRELNDKIIKVLDSLGYKSIDELKFAETNTFKISDSLTTTINQIDALCRLNINNNLQNINFGHLELEEPGFYEKLLLVFKREDERVEEASLEELKEITGESASEEPEENDHKDEM